jgi:hypothetical protein
VSGTNRFVAAADKWMVFDVALFIQAPPSQNLAFIDLYINGGTRTVRLWHARNPISTSSNMLAGGSSPPIKLSAGDYVEVYCGSDNTLALATAKDLTWFGGYQVS